VGIPFIIYAMRKPSWNQLKDDEQFEPFHWEEKKLNNSTKKL
jgi:hypothetical protein